MNSWLSFGANIGVIIGLAILIVEVRQNNDIARVQFYLDNSGSAESIEHAITGENAAEAWAKSVEVPESLSTSEIRVLDSVLGNVLLSLNRSRILVQQGYLEERRQLSFMEAQARVYFGNRFARAWWNDEKKNWPHDFVESFGVVLEKVSASTDARRIEKIRQELENPPTA